MKIGIDITPLQGPHRMRGVGFTLINFINNLPVSVKKDHTFVLFHYPFDKNKFSPLDLLELDNLNYKTKVIHPIPKINKTLPGRLSMLIGLLNQLRVLKDLYFGDSGIKNSKSKIDYFLQFDQNQPLPAKKIAPSCLILYDLIPYIMETDYFWSYSTARARGGSILSSLRLQYRRKRFICKTKMICKRAKKMIAISEHTKNDFVQQLGIPSKKIDVCLLGVVKKRTEKLPSDPEFNRYIDTSWGLMPQKVELVGKKFLLFVGGADYRRKIEELVAAFNNLRARGEDIKLVLAGDTMIGASYTPNEVLFEYFKDTSYLEDIYFMGFIDDAQRDWLYEHALAFVYPSVYEGFGLPILEAMQYGTPVITYKNSSIPEVAGNAVLYAKDFSDIYEHVVELINDGNKKHKISIVEKNQAKKFSWNKTSGEIVKSLDAII